MSAHHLAPPTRRLPKAPVLGWHSFVSRSKCESPSVADLPHRLLLTSGRAALYAALKQTALPAGSKVLVPTYHCPTMVAPILEAGFVPVFYPIGPDGLPDLERIASAPGEHGVMFVAHLFGLPQGLGAVAAWCQQHQVVLVEDCAHAYFGTAGNKPVGTWGDFATASLTKFFPVSEAGLLASATSTITTAELRHAGLRAQLKSAWDVAHVSYDHGELAGVRQVVGAILRLSGIAPRSAGTSESTQQVGPDEIRAGCDMGRVRQAPCLPARWLYLMLPTADIVNLRRQNFLSFQQALSDAPGARQLPLPVPADAAPYALPLWIDGPERADAVYARMRHEGLPVFRWDRRWPGTPEMAGDHGTLWARQVLQLLCHQSLRADEVDYISSRTLEALQASS